MDKFGYYFTEIFEPTILFGMFSGIVGVVAAWHYGSFNLFTAALAVLGVGLAQMAVNLIDDWEDYVSGLDKETIKTKFSGGSEIVVKKKVKLSHVLWIGMFALLVAALIGIYLFGRFPVLLPLVLIGGATVILYAKYLSKIPYFSEPLTAINFALIPFGCFIAAGGAIGSISPFAFAACAIGLQVGLTVLINYMPDRKPDKKFGRRNIVAMITDNRKIASMYIFTEVISFLLILIGIVLGMIPLVTLLVFLTVPAVLGVWKEIPKYKNPKSFERVMGMATMAELEFIVLLAIAFLF